MNTLTEGIIMISLVMLEMILFKYFRTLFNILKSFIISHKEVILDHCKIFVLFWIVYIPSWYIACHIESKTQIFHKIGEIIVKILLSPSQHYPIYLNEFGIRNSIRYTLIKNVQNGMLY